MRHTTLDSTQPSGSFATVAVRGRFLSAPESKNEAPAQAAGGNLSETATRAQSRLSAGSRRLRVLHLLAGTTNR
jgi:hypothetical protein